MYVDVRQKQWNLVWFLRQVDAELSVNVDYVTEEDVTSSIKLVGYTLTYDGGPFVRRVVKSTRIYSTQLAGELSWFEYELLCYNSCRHISTPPCPRHDPSTEPATTDLIQGWIKAHIHWYVDVRRRRRVIRWAAPNTPPPPTYDGSRTYVHGEFGLKTWSK